MGDNANSNLLGNKIFANNNININIKAKLNLDENMNS